VSQAAFDEETGEPLEALYRKGEIAAVIVLVVLVAS
jgi:hypothetical protein